MPNSERWWQDQSSPRSILPQLSLPPWPPHTHTQAQQPRRKGPYSTWEDGEEGNRLWPCPLSQAGGQRMGRYPGGVVELNGWRPGKGHERGIVRKRRARAVQAPGGKPRRVSTMKPAPDTRVQWEEAPSLERGWGRTPGAGADPGGPRPPPPPGLKASAHLLPPRLQDVQPHTHRFALTGHALALAAPITHTHTPPKHTHEHTRARTHLPLRSASYLPRRRGSSGLGDAGLGAGTGAEAGPAPSAASGSGRRSAGAGLGRGSS